MDEPQYCLYLPGVCVHVSQVILGPQDLEDTRGDAPSIDGPPGVDETRKSDRRELHHDVNTFPERFTFHFFKPPPLHLHPFFQNITPPETPSLPAMASLPPSAPPTPELEHPDCREIAALICADKAFENTSTSVAASQMRNALNNLADTVSDPEEKKVGFPPPGSSHIPGSCHIALRDRDGQLFRAVPQILERQGERKYPVSYEPRIS